MPKRRIYEVRVPDDVSLDEALAQARRRAADVGIRIEGDVSGGTFEGPARGRYRTADRMLTLEVEAKPAFVPWSLVESGLKRVFGAVTVQTEA